MSRLLVLLAAAIGGLCGLGATPGAVVPVAPEPDPPGPSAAARLRSTPSATEPVVEPVAELDEPPPCPPLDARWQSAPGPAVKALAARAVSLAASLAYVGPVNVAPDRVDIVVPPATRANLRRYKQVMADAIEARLGEAVRLANGDSVPACGLEAFMGNSLGASRESSFVTAVRGELRGRVLGVVFEAPMTGGNDSSLVLFERTTSGAYRRAMMVASHEPASITDGFLALDFVARATPDGGYHVLTVHGSPWISSAWRGANLRVWAPASEAAHPRLLLAEHHSARMGQTLADLRADDTGFAARFESWGGVGVAGGVRTIVRHWALVNGSYQRTAPFVMEASHLPDEWMHTPWSEASQFTASSERARLEDVHRTLRANSDLRTSIASAVETHEGDRTVWTLEDHDENLRYAFVTATENGLPVLVDVREPGYVAPSPGKGATAPP